jgi:outer membrane protein OmpA-like peptidoglycan-associated protein
MFRLRERFHRRLCQHLLCAGLWLFSADFAAAQARLPQQPSVEVNLDVLQNLSTSAAPFDEPYGAAPVTEVSSTTVPRYQPAEEERKVPQENPYSPTPRAPSVVASPGGMPFYRGESPASRLPISEPEPVKIAAKTEAKTEAPKPLPAKPEVPKTSTATPDGVIAAEAPKADVKQQVAEASTPPVAETKPGEKPSPGSGSPMRVEKVIPPVLPDPIEAAGATPPPLPAELPAFPDAAALPAAAAQPPAIPPVIPPVAAAPAPPPIAAAPPAAPAPDISGLDFSQLEQPKAPEAPAIPPLKEPIAMPNPPAPAAPEVLVASSQKQGALPELPLLPEKENKNDEHALSPTLTQRVAAMFAKEPAQQGMISDTTRVIDPVAENAEKQQALESVPPPPAEKPAAKPAEEKTEAKPPIPLPNISLPDVKDSEPALPPAELPAAKSDAKVAAVPTLQLPPEQLIPAANADSASADLAPPALPSIDQITGDDVAQNSVDIAAANDQIFATDTPTDSAANNANEGALPVVKTEEKAETATTLPPLAINPGKESKPSDKKPTEIASLAPPARVETSISAQGDASVSVAFAKDKQELSDAEKSKLLDLAERIKSENKEVRIIAYASGNAEQSSMARRVSLSRALQIRAYLIDKGVDQLKLSVQALGNKVPSGSADRADIFLR